MKWLSLVFGVVFSILSVWTPNLSASEITLTNGEWAPYLSQKLKHGGFFSHIVSEAFALEGIVVKYKYYPWKRSYALAARGDFAGSVGWAPTEERKQDFFFTQEVTNNQKVFFHLKSVPFDWKTIDDLKTFKIGVTSQYTYGLEFDQAVKNKVFKVQTVSRDELNVRKLLAGRIQVFPMEKEVGYGLINRVLKPLDVELVTHHSKAVQRTPISVAISKAIPPSKSKELLEAFNRGLNKLKKSGRYQQIIQNARLGKYDK